MDDHFCIPDENDNCVDCGQHMDFPEVTDMPDFGDIVGICNLVTKTAHAYALLIKHNTDPKDPSQPKLRMVGRRMIRLPHKALFTKQLAPSTYIQAKALGYKGTIDRWGEIVEEHTYLAVPQ